MVIVSEYRRVSSAVPTSDGELYLVKIQDVDDEKGMMKSSGWVGFSWMDEYARWNPAEFGGIKVGGKKALI